MYLIIGLGNPEPEYSMTRHNLGFDVINKLANEFNIKVEKKKFDGTDQRKQNGHSAHTQATFFGIYTDYNFNARSGAL